MQVAVGLANLRSLTSLLLGVIWLFLELPRMRRRCLWIAILLGVGFGSFIADVGYGAVFGGFVEDGHGVGEV